MSTSTTPNYLF